MTEILLISNVQSLYLYAQDTLYGLEIFFNSIASKDDSH